MDRKIRRLRQLQRVTVVVRSQGRYPTKARTLVADVCRYQNDGTERITPARFIERAVAEMYEWQDEVDTALSAYLAGAGREVFAGLAKQVASDISRICDRIRTGQLKASFVGTVERN